MPSRVAEGIGSAEAVDALIALAGSDNSPEIRVVGDSRARPSAGEKAVDVLTQQAGKCEC